MSSRRCALVAIMCLLISGSGLTAAGAQEPEAGITLAASRDNVVFRQSTRLFGATSPPSPGEPVQILDQNGAVVAETITDENGEYSVTYVPRANVELRAQWLAALSEPLLLQVRALVAA